LSRSTQPSSRARARRKAAATRRRRPLACLG
jgi:hypothetical protein